MLEYAVRPFTSPNAQGRIIIPATPGATTQRARITWGAKSTNVPTPQVSDDFQVICCSDQLHELERTVDVVEIPIVQTDDSTGKVTVARSKTVKLRKEMKNNQCDSPLDTYLGAEFGLDDSGDTSIDLGFSGTEKPGEKCGAIWNLNNNTAAG
jgi:hypothetical protein